jgi:hypothetical protein
MHITCPPENRLPNNHPSAKSINSCLLTSQSPYETTSSSPFQRLDSATSAVNETLAAALLRHSLPTCRKAVRVRRCLRGFQVAMCLSLSDRHSRITVPCPIMCHKAVLTSDHKALDPSSRLRQCSLHDIQIEDASLYLLCLRLHTG